MKSIIGMAAVIILASCEPKTARPVNNNIPQPAEQVQVQAKPTEQVQVQAKPAEQVQVQAKPAEQVQVQKQEQVQAQPDPNQLIAAKRKELAKLYKELAEINKIKALNKMTRKQNPWLDDAYADMPVHPLDSQNELFDYEVVEIHGKISIIQAEIYGLQQIIVNQPTH